jgi:DNA-binding LacI/PurR family transcriptional regulator
MPFAVAAGPSRLGFLMEIAAAAASAALENGMALILVPPMERGRAPFADLQMDGAIVVEPAADDPDVAALRQRGIPVVSIGRQVGARDLAFVDLQSDFTARQLLDHLHDEGARRIALIVGAQRRNSYLEAERAYRRFAASSGMKPTVIKIDEGEGEALARDMVLALLTRDSGIDGLCVPVDVFAVGAAKAAQMLGRRIPEDLKIATRYDGIRARECSPPLTAVTLHLDQLAALAVGLLLDQIDGRGARGLIAGPRPELIIRTSSRSARLQG